MHVFTTYYDWQKDWACNFILSQSCMTQIVPVRTTFGECTYKLSTYTSFIDRVENDDKRTWDICETVKRSERNLVMSNDVVVDYFLSKCGAFLKLSKFSFRLLATPPPYAISERDFSLLKLALSKHKCKLKDDIIDYTAALYSDLRGLKWCQE